MEQSTAVIRVLCSSGSRPLCTAAETEGQSGSSSKDDSKENSKEKENRGLGWGSSTSGRTRQGGAAVRELLLIGPLVWASAAGADTSPLFCST